MVTEKIDAPKYKSGKFWLLNTTSANTNLFVHGEKTAVFESNILA
jgi:hypothetical protein